jgi:hypothetical protein
MRKGKKRGTRMNRDDENVFGSGRGYDEVASGRAAPGFRGFYFQSVGFKGSETLTRIFEWYLLACQN